MYCSFLVQLDPNAKRKERHCHSYKGQVGKIAPNVLERDFSTENPNQKWTTDVSQVCIKDEMLYLSPILDMYNGEIVTYMLSHTPNLKMVTDMLKGAFRKYKNLDGLVMHSDQEWHYQHTQYQNMLSKHGIVQSMSWKGNSLDNSMMENFFGLMKNELLYVNNFNSIDEFEKELRNYILWYNTKRIKLRLKRNEPGTIPSSLL